MVKKFQKKKKKKTIEKQNFIIVHKVSWGHDLTIKFQK